MFLHTIRTSLIWSVLFWSPDETCIECLGLFLLQRKTSQHSLPRSGIGFSGTRIHSILNIELTQQKIQTTLWVTHSSVVEKLSVVDKTLPPDNFYLVNALSSGHLSEVDENLNLRHYILMSTFPRVDFYLLTFCLNFKGTYWKSWTHELTLVIAFEPYHATYEFFQGCYEPCLHFFKYRADL